MAVISINWATKVINIPQDYLTWVSGTFYTLDTDKFRLDLKALEASIYGMPNMKTHNHNTSVTVAGITYARTIEICSGYSVTFADGQYTVKLTGSNNNIFDVGNYILNQNQVQVIPTNAAGLITVVSGPGVTDKDKTDIISGVWNNLIETGLTTSQVLQILIAVAAGKDTITDLGEGLATVKFRDINDTKDRVTADMDGSERTHVTLDTD